MGEKKNVITVVLVAVKKGDKILLLKRENPPLKGYWGLIGGKLHTDESIEEAAIRETKEETNLDSEFLEIKGVLHERMFEGEDCRYGYVFFFVAVKPKNSDLISSHEGEVRWFRIDSLDGVNMILSDRWMIHNLLGKKIKVREIIMQEEKGRLVGLKVE